ncbi:PST family polysaccharide transporter [Herbiconiux flava]|uniref:PST family polysaccharide transporter n=1 Tax=Herbiconiux flava TaxID=881268 RepID=A0A852SJP8_9MICO|nr:PST family polysaccharide transporter [Herbiconiux flava]
MTSFLVFAILTRLIAVEDFGLLSLATIFTGVLLVFVDSSISRVLVQRKTVTLVDSSTAFWTSVGLSVLLYALLAATAPLLGALLGEPRLGLVLQIMGLSLPIAAVSSVPAAMLERELKFKALSVRQLSGTLAGAAVAVPLALAGAGVWALVVQTLVSVAVAAVVLWLRGTWRPAFRFSRESLRSMVGFGAGSLGIDLMTYAQANIDKLLVGALFGPTTLGYYYVAQRALILLSELITSVIGRISLTTFSRVQDDLPRLRRAMMRMTFVTAGIAIMVFGTIALLAEQILPFLVGGDWGPSTPIFQLLAPSAALLAVTSFDGPALLALGAVRQSFLLSLSQNIFGILLLLAAAPFGVLAVALSRSVRVLLFWPVRLIVLRRYVEMPALKYSGQVLRSLAAFLPSAAFIVGMQFTPWAEVSQPFWAFAVPVALVSAVLYLPLAWLFAGDENRAAVGSVLGDFVRRRPKST